MAPEGTPSYASDPCTNRLREGNSSVEIHTNSSLFAVGIAHTHTHMISGVRVARSGNRGFEACSAY